MPAGSVAVKERHQPLVLVETAGLSEEKWLAYRRKGIGGSDVAALLGISPWRTARDLFYDKLNIAVVSSYSSETPDSAFLHSCSYLPFCNCGISSKPFPAFGQKKSEGDNGRNA